METAGSDREGKKDDTDDSVDDGAAPHTDTVIQQLSGRRSGSLCLGRCTAAGAPTPYPLLATCYNSAY